MWCPLTWQKNILHLRDFKVCWSSRLIRQMTVPKVWWHVHKLNRGPMTPYLAPKQWSSASVSIPLERFHLSPRMMYCIYTKAHGHSQHLQTERGRWTQPENVETEQLVQVWQWAGEVSLFGVTYCATLFYTIREKCLSSWCVFFISPVRSSWLRFRKWVASTSSRWRLQLLHQEPWRHHPRCSAAYCEPSP